MKKKIQKVQISERALYARISRALAKQGEMLRRCRQDSPSWHNLGDYYTIDTDSSLVFHTFLHLEALGRELKVLKPFEELAND